ncbi:MAG: Bax inhibitor-1/YccA family protein [Bifidobacteriaceae bacterium]|jgi:uncharacterized YccA/Bax inhibitor family protein|nr:Bax inhibitor-1/YccA family protein [Bifidobacteriaceae bacterium]
MANPVFNRADAFNGRTAVQPVNPYAQPGYAAPSAAELGTMYQAPSASPVDTGRLTYEDVLIKSIGMLAVLLVGATFGWVFAPVVFGMIWFAAIAALALGLVNSFKREPSPVLITLYAILEGVFVGCLSRLYNIAWDGIVLQAVIASLAVFGTMLALFASGKVRATAKGTKIMLGLMLGYIVFSIINCILMVTGAVTDPWGLRTSLTIFGLPLGVVLGVLVVALAAYSFVVDFDAIQRGVRGGAPARYAWTAAFGLLVTLVWLYLEILRLLAILRR